MRRHPSSSFRFFPAIAAAALLLPAATLDGQRATTAVNEAGPRRVQVLFIGHRSTHHNSSELAPLLARALAPDGINITYSENPNDLNPDHLALYDAVMIYANHATGTPQQIAAILDFVS